jgi:hypothetical protein
MYAGSVDPFNSLPIPVSLEVDHLIKYCKLADFRSVSVPSITDSDCQFWPNSTLDCPKLAVEGLGSRTHCRARQ